jgi:hypothetical protein
MMNLHIDHKFNTRQRELIELLHGEAITRVGTLLGASQMDNLYAGCKIIKYVCNGRMRTCGGRATTNRRDSMGQIDMNKRLFESTGKEENFINTLRHEIAHIITNFATKTNAGHNNNWRNVFLHIGGNGERATIWT